MYITHTKPNKHTHTHPNTNTPTNTHSNTQTNTHTATSTDTNIKCKYTCTYKYRCKRKRKYCGVVIIHSQKTGRCQLWRERYNVPTITTITVCYCRGGLTSAFPATSLDTFRNRRKGDPPHECCRNETEMIEHISSGRDEHFKEDCRVFLM